MWMNTQNKITERDTEINWYHSSWSWKFRCLAISCKSSTYGSNIHSQNKSMKIINVGQGITLGQHFCHYQLLWWTSTLWYLLGRYAHSEIWLHQYGQCSDNLCTGPLVTISTKPQSICKECTIMLWIWFCIRSQNSFHDIDDYDEMEVDPHVGLNETWSDEWYEWWASLCLPGICIQPLTYKRWMLPQS